MNLKGKYVYIVEAWPYASAQIFASSKEAERYIKELAERHSFKYDEESDRYITLKGNTIYARYTEIL